jgi:hypothetical protein
MGPAAVDTAANAKILTVRNYLGTDNRSREPLDVVGGAGGPEAVPELAEQLNADISRKYVKGMLASWATCWLL